MASCIFCDIVNEKVPAAIVARTEAICAFMDIRPVNPGHVLVIPTTHAAGLHELDPATGGRMFQAGQAIAQALRDGPVTCEGVNLHLADGRAAGQEVLHVHLHVWPRFAGDGFGFRLGPHNRRPQPREQLAALAAKIASSLNLG